MEFARWVHPRPQVRFFTWAYESRLTVVCRIDSLNVRDDTEIDWKTISDADWNLWSAHTLQRRWFTLKRSVKGHENMTHQGSLPGHLSILRAPC